MDDTRVKTLGLGKSQDENESYEVDVLVYSAGSVPAGGKIATVKQLTSLTEAADNILRVCMLFRGPGILAWVEGIR